MPSPAQEGKVLALGHLPTLDADGKTTPELEALLRQSPLRRRRLFPRHSPPEQRPHQTFRSPQPPPPLATIGFIRRKLPNADIYFVANTRNTSIDLHRQLRHNPPTRPADRPRHPRLRLLTPIKPTHPPRPLRVPHLPLHRRQGRPFSLHRPANRRLCPAKRNPAGRHR